VNWAQVSAGQGYTCGTKTDGTLRCWGSNSFGWAPVITLAPASLPNAVVGAAYTQNLSASGGSAAPYSFSVVAGELPAGLALNPDGTWSGAPSAAGTFNFTVQAADANNLVNTHDYVLTVVIDSTPPEITAQIAGTQGQNDWYVSDVALSWSVTDGESAVSASSGCDPVSVTGDQAETDYTCTAASAGGTNSKTVTIKRDVTAPVVAVTGVMEGGAYVLGAVPVGCSTNDVTSGVGTDAALSLAGGSTLGVGQFTATCSGALDNAGNPGNTATVHYNVTFLFTGFTAPVDNPAVINVAKAGQTIPLKWRITDANGNPVTNLTSVTVTAVTLACPVGTTTDLVEEYSSGSSGLQNLGNGYYQWNWKSPSTYASSCKTLQLSLGDGLFHTALFQFKK
jgi:hypothetical protein